jgi:hypothetical protein
MQAIAERVPAHVTGDGTHTVRELVDITNSDPRRGVGHEKVLTKIKVDAAAEELVREQGFGLDDACVAAVPRKPGSIPPLSGRSRPGSPSSRSSCDAPRWR